jgi:hypothetical protein
MAVGGWFKYKREREVYRERMSSGCNSALGRASLKARDGINVIGK